jgi:nitroimidazol reductase NimA-like FMN-containing flavoprotein (pyridoxamine 5'-phosphate oxidase superfamily)
VPADRAHRSGPWDESAIDRFLAETVIPIRIATVGRSGPLVQSMWFAWDGGTFWCATQDSALVVQRLTADPRCGFEVAGDTLPYRGVRGSGLAEVRRDEGREVLQRLIGRYLGGAETELGAWLLSRADREVAIAIRPDTMASWDYRRRMGE